MVSIEKRIRKSSPNLYVYYDAESGEISSVGHNLQEKSNLPFILTNSEVAKKIVDGVKSVQDYIVDVSSPEPILITKREILESSDSLDLYKIPSKRRNDWELKLCYYSINKLLTIEISQAIQNRLTYYSKIKSQEIGNKIDVYIALEKNPDHLIDHIEVDMDELVTTRVLAIPAAELFDGYNVQDISFLTNSRINRCYKEIINDEYLGNNVKSKAYGLQWQWAKTKGTGHIEIIQQDDILIITAQAVDQLRDLNISERTMPCYIVTYSPDHLIGKFDLNLEKLLAGKVLRFGIDFDLNDVMIMYSMPKLNIRKRKIE